MDNLLLPIIRHVLTAGGGALVTGGYLENADATAGVGAIMTLIGIGMSFYNARKKKA